MPETVSAFLAIVTLDAGLALTGSPVVWSRKFVLVYVAGTGFVIPVIATEPVALAASVQPAGSVIVTTLLAFAPVAPAAQPAKLPPNVTAGEAGIPAANAAAKVTVTVLPATRAPVDVAVNVSVQVVDAPYVVDAPANAMEVGAPRTITAPAGFTAAVSRVVFTLSVAAA